MSRGNHCVFCLAYPWKHFPGLLYPDASQSAPHKNQIHGPREEHSRSREEKCRNKNGRIRKFLLRSSLSPQHQQVKGGEIYFVLVSEISVLVWLATWWTGEAAHKVAARRQSKRKSYGKRHPLPGHGSNHTPLLIRSQLQNQAS